MENKQYTLGIDIGSTTVKIAILDSAHNILFSDFLPFRENIFEILGIRYKGPLPLTGRLDYQNFFWENF